MFLCILDIFNVCANRSSSLPWKTLLIKRLTNNPTFNSVTLWHHRVTHLHNTCTYQRVWNDEVISHSCSAGVSGVSSGMCELTNQRRLGIQEEQKQSISDGGRWQSCCNGQYEKACKPILEITQPCYKLLFCIILHKSFKHYRSATITLFDTTGQLISESSLKVD